MGGRTSGSGKTLAEHKRDGSFRPGRHAHLLSDENIFSPPKRAAGKITASAKSQRRWITNAGDDRAVRNGCRFNERLADHFVECCRLYFRHSKGQWAGERFEFFPWQLEQIVFPLFGWVRPDGQRRFRRTYIEMPKKQGKSALASCVGNYMLFCDGEAGAEVYSLGADKDQARIVHGEAISMVEASPELRHAAKVNRTTGAITYEATRSTYKALSSVPRGKAGFNIHCAIVDELHEWYGVDLWEAIRYGFRARRQPLLFVITNAGDDKESVCWRQHEKAAGVLDGSIEDEGFLPLLYRATDTEADGEIIKVKNGATDLPVAKRCNPALGSIVSEVDLLQDIRDAVSNPSELANLKRLTYSVWSTGTAPWLSADKWAACYDPDCGSLLYRDGWQYTPGKKDLSGETCWLGVDLSKSRDFTAAVLVFPSDGAGEFWQLPLFWLPSETATKKSNLARYHEWSDQGFTRLVPGDVIDYDALVGDLVGLRTTFNPLELMYDPWQAEPIRQRLESEGFDCVKVQQTISHLASPTRDYERLILEKKLHHSGNAVLTWQAGHVEVKSDNNQNVRPVKRAHGDYRTIDGIVAGVMALSGALTYEPVPNYYDENELEAA